MKEVLIINGYGGVGKDTFVDCLSQFSPTLHTSIINPIKNIAKQVGWNGSKNEKDRAFLCDLQLLIKNYNDYPWQYISEYVEWFNSPQNGEFEILCIDMRDIVDIKRAIEKFRAKTVLVVRNKIEHIRSNTADANVFNMDYNYIINNSSDIEHLKKEAKELIEKLHKQEEHI